MPLQVMREFQGYGAAAFVATVFLTPVAMRLAHRFNVLDIPDQKLKPHARPIPYLGGAAICAGWVLSLLLAMLTGAVQNWPTLSILMLGGLGMSVLGLIDDVRGLSPRLRLLVGGAIVTAVILSTGAGTQIGASLVSGAVHVMSVWGWHVPGFLVHPPPLLLTSISVVVSVFVVLGACNSTNLIDGLDGLCSGVTALISLSFFLLATHLAIWEFSRENDPVRLTLAIAMCGSALGFLPWNFNPARIFMGDAGSVLLGYNCGMLILLFGEAPGVVRWVIAALMIFALPVFDTMLAMFRRWRAGRSIFEGDRSHFYDQLVQRGFSVRKTVLICYALTVVYAAIGLMLIWMRYDANMKPQPVIQTRWVVLLYLGIFVVTALIAWRMGLTSPEGPRRAARQRVSAAGGKAES